MLPDRIFQQGEPLTNPDGSTPRFYDHEVLKVAIATTDAWHEMIAPLAALASRCLSEMLHTLNEQED